MQSAIQHFTLSLLAYKGALIEADGGSASVLLGRELSAALGLDEYEQMTFDRSTERPDARRVDYDTPLFEAAGRLVDSMGRMAWVGIPAPELRAIDPEAELEQALKFRPPDLQEFRMSRF